MIYEFSSVMNMRELGGLKTSGGKTVRSNMLFRSAELSRINSDDIKKLQDFGISAVIDFRDEIEVLKEPDRQIIGAKYYHLPALPPLDSYDGYSNDALGDLFSNSVDSIFKVIYNDLSTSEVSFNAYRRFFEIILESNGSPILWHCTQGKDRTGIGAILLLTALGVPEDDIMEEYFITNTVMQKQYEKATAKGVNDIFINNFKLLMFVHKECIDIYMNNIKSGYGSIMNFIKTKLNVTDSDIEKLRSWYLD